MLTPARRVTLPAEPIFCFSVDGSPSFVRKYRKSWLAQGSSDRRVTLLPGKTFLHINRALGWLSGIEFLSLSVLPRVSKVFDHIDHTMLIYKLVHLGVRCMPINPQFNLLHGVTAFKEETLRDTLVLGVK